MAYLSATTFVQIIDYVLEGILSGKFPEEDRIPSVRDMAVLMQVAPNTVVHAYDKLLSQGLIYAQRGLGNFVSVGARDKVRAQRRKLFFEEVLPVIRRDMDLLEIPHEEVRKALDL